MSDSFHAVVAALDDHMSDFVIEMMKEAFNIDVALIKDPETAEVVMQNLDGSNITPDQYYALVFFERGWFSALQSVGTLSETFDKTGEIRYTGPNDTIPGEETE